MRALKHGDHLCGYYASRLEQLPIVAAYIKDGLARGERCLYLVDDSVVHEVTHALVAANVAVTRERRRGALVLLAAEDVYLEHGAFDCEAMLQLLNDAIEQALHDEFTGLRVAGEMTWLLRSEHGPDCALEYESLLNEFFSRRRATGLCLYNQSRLPAKALDGALRTHPRVVVGEKSYANRYFAAHTVPSHTDERAQFEKKLARVTGRASLH